MECHHPEQKKEKSIKESLQGNQKMKREDKLQ